MRTLLSLFVLLICAQTQAPPPRDAATTGKPLTGTAVISGHVLAADTGVPIYRAWVTISGGPGGRGVSRTVGTDARGRYIVPLLPAGSYQLSASPSKFQGQFLPSVTPPPSPSGEPVRLAVADGQTIHDYDLVLPRAGAIVGRIVDEIGNPVSNVPVNAIKAGDRQTSGYFPSQISDELGRFRIFHLPPGEYHVVARASEAGGESFTYDRHVGFADTYLPGTASREAASRVRVHGGQETAAGDLQLTRIRLMTIGGTVVDSHGAPASGRTMISLNSDRSGEGRSADTGGRFSFQSKPPGSYELAAILREEDGENAVEYGHLSVTLREGDAENLVIAMKPTVGVEGRLVFDSAPAPSTPAGAVSIRPALRQRSSRGPLILHPAAVASDQTFTVRHAAGELLLRPEGRIMRDWTLKARLVGDRDITDTPTDFREEDSGRVSVVLTTRGSELAGTITDEKSDRATSCAIVLFGADKATWFQSSSRFRESWPLDGRFSIKGLRPGPYYLIALPRERWPNSNASDSADFESLAREATQVVLGEDEQRVVDLKLAAGGGGH